ncbi:nucleotidyltransferase domain-containing protein [Bifidobacterium thermacidophilum]|jgi:predicted nucleotidyltransferase|uniref:Nucleotidyltransferase domain-containing protein n=1 Tax=Bifidobacterium thermacidophilum TaxID=246618 RepID=A0ABW8KTQ6_9BIFI
MKALDVISRVAMPQQIAEIARPIALRHHVNELYLFGSMARGEGHTDSDIDFIYQFDDTANPMIVSGLCVMILHRLLVGRSTW